MAEEKKVGAEKPTAPARKVKAPAKVYIGPSKFGNFHIVSSTIYKGGILPKRVQDMAAKNPDFARLIVGVKELGTALAALRNKDSEIAKAARAFAKYKEV